MVHEFLSLLLSLRWLNIKQKKQFIDRYESRKFHDYNHFVLIPFHFVIKLFVFRSDLASSDGFFTSASDWLQKPESHQSIVRILQYDWYSDYELDKSKCLSSRLVNFKHDGNIFNTEDLLSKHLRISSFNNLLTKFVVKQSQLFAAILDQLPLLCVVWFCILTHFQSENLLSWRLSNR